MSRPLPSRKTIESWLSEYPGLVFDENLLRVQCIICNITILSTRKSDVKKHCFSDKHKALSKGELTISEKQKQFNLDLVKLMVGCNIPWSKLENPFFSQFLVKCKNGEYSDVKVPNESTLRKNYLHHVSSQESSFQSEEGLNPITVKLQSRSKTVNEAAAKEEQPLFKPTKRKIKFNTSVQSTRESQKLAKVEYDKTSSMDLIQGVTGF